jgi:Xaa-Pro aminopeptidase
MSKRFFKVLYASLLFLLVSTSLLLAQQPVAPALPYILSMQERAEVRDRWLDHRLNTIMPDLMRKHDIDMWILISREYNEDPVLLTMLPATWQSARRRTMLVFYDNGETVERIAVARYDIGALFKSAWNKEEQPDQWKRLAEIVAERDPQRIGINTSETFALADGLPHTEYTLLQDALPRKYSRRLVSAQPLAIGWLETRSEPEMTVYPQIVRMAHHIIAEGFSEKVIQPGVTTTEDVQWWYRDRIRELKLTTWFHPSVSMQRAEAPEHSGDFSSHEGATVIQPGDLLHVDFGITYLGLNTDTQQHAYVLKAGETEAPEGLQEALAKGNQLQDYLTKAFAVGRSGNDVLKTALENANAAGLRPSIYTHPIGYHGHAAGPTIGLWDQQDGVPGAGDYPLRANTAYSIELNVTERIPEWDKDVRIMLEEDAFFDGEQVRYIDGRQKELWLIPRPSAVNR